MPASHHSRMPPFHYPLASLDQIQNNPSVADGIPQDLEAGLRAFGCKLIQQAGILLKQNQVAMSTAQVLFHRFWYVTSMKQFGIGDVGMGALYLASKLEECPIRMRDLINVYDLLLSRMQHASPSDLHYKPMTYFSSRFYDLKEALVISEMQILKRLGFNVQVVLPYGTLVNYLQVLGLISHEEACQKAWGFLNDALQTPVYVLYPIPTIVSASIFLASRHLGLPLPKKWYEIFDADLDDMWCVAGSIMRLYREYSPDEQALLIHLVDKKQLRSWLDEQQRTSSKTTVY